MYYMQHSIRTSHLVNAKEPLWHVHSLTHASNVNHAIEWRRMDRRGKEDKMADKPHIALEVM